MTPGYITDNVSKCITRCIIKTLIFGQQDESAYLHSLSLVRSCTQKAVSLLRDSVNKASRSMVRMHTLLGLLENDVGHNGGQLIHWHNLLIYYLKYWEVRHKKYYHLISFCALARYQEILLRRLVVALTQREEDILDSGDWVNREIMKREALQEGGTLR